jgi:Spy/CpxP family protein refolding chaperone
MKIPIRTLALATCLALSLGGYVALHAQDATPRPRGFGMRGGGPGFDSLSQEEKDKLRAAMQKAAEDPKVKAAREKMEAAAKELREATSAAEIAADPSVEPIVKKLQEARAKAEQEGGGRRGGDQKPNN